MTTYKLELATPAFNLYWQTNGTNTSLPITSDLPALRVGDTLLLTEKGTTREVKYKVQGISSLDSQFKQALLYKTAVSEVGALSVQIAQQLLD